MKVPTNCIIHLVETSFVLFSQVKKLKVKEYYWRDTGG